MEESTMVSIIVPVYNVENYIEKCIKSILTQSYKNIEILLIDDGSKDASGDICDKLAETDSRIRVFHQENSGVSVTRNKGLDEANGEYIAFVDSDDIVSSNYVEILLRACISNNAKMSQCNHERFEDENEIHYFNGKADGNISIVSGRDICKKIYSTEGVNATVLWNKMYHASLFKGLRFPVGKIHEDLYLSYRVYYGVERVATVPYILYHYRVTPESITQKTFSKKNLFYLDAVQSQVEFYDEMNDIELYEKGCGHYGDVVITFYRNAREYLNREEYNPKNLVSNMKMIVAKLEEKGLKVSLKYKAFCKYPFFTAMSVKYQRAIKRRIRFS